MHWPTPSRWDIDVETFNSHTRVQYYLDFFQGRGRERMAIWLTRMPRYEAMIRERLQRESLPGDLVYLALIESGFSNTATSRAKAVGMWQFMKATGKGYGLRVDSWVDERRDPIRATDAAVRHLRDLNRRFNSLYLAAAAYNAGSGKVSRGLGRLPDDESDSPRLRCHVLPAVRHQAAAARDQGLRPQADRGRADREAAGALRLQRRDGRACRLRLHHRTRYDRPRRARPAGGHHRRRHPRAEPAVSPARHAAGYAAPWSAFRWDMAR